MTTRTLTVTVPNTGRVLTRQTTADYTHVATDGYYATWHTRRDLAEKSARANGWWVLAVDKEAM